MMEQLLGDLVESPWLLVCSRGGMGGRCCGCPSTTALRKHLVFTKGLDGAATVFARGASTQRAVSGPQDPPFPRVSQGHPKAVSPIKSSLCCWGSGRGRGNARESALELAGYHGGGCPPWLSVRGRGKQHLALQWHDLECKTQWSRQVLSKRWAW